MALLTQDFQVNTALLGITWTEAFVGLVNDRRAYYGLPPYKVATSAVYGANAEDIAQAHTENMESTQCFAHDADVFPVGWRTFDERALRTGRPQSAENILVMELKFNFDPNVAPTGPDTYPAGTTNLPQVIVNDWTFPSPREAFEAWWNSPGHRENLLRDWGEGVDDIYSMMGITIGQEAITDGRYPPDVYPFDPPFDPGATMVWFTNVMINLEPAVLEKTLHINSSIAGANILTQNITFRLDAMTKVRASHQSSWSISLSAVHTGAYGAMVSVQHVAPIHYSLSAAFEAQYTQSEFLVSSHEASYRIRSTVDVPTDHVAEYASKLTVDHNSWYTDQNHVMADHQSPYQDTHRVTEVHQAEYGGLLPTVATFMAPYGVPVPVSTTMTLLYGDAPVLNLVHQAYYDDITRVLVGHDAPYTKVLGLTATHMAGYEPAVELAVAHTGGYSLMPQVVAAHSAVHYLTASIKTDHGALFDVSTTNPVKAENRAFWASQSTASTMVTPIATLTLASGKVVSLTDAVASLDEDSYAWQARIRINSIEDYVEVQREDIVTLNLAGEEYLLLVTAKSIGRPKTADVDMVLTAMSPCIMLDAPRSQTLSIRVTEPAYIKDIAEAVATVPLDWQLPNWLVPANRIQFDGLTPMAVLQKLAAVVGGIVQSNRDGTITVRPLFPVTMSQYQNTPPVHIITDADGIFSVSEDYEFHDGFTRFRIREGETTYGDRMDWVADPGNTPTGTLRVMPSPMRENFSIDCTDFPDATIYTGSGMVSREETETVEFKGGTASMAYPVYSVVSVEWLSNSLGDLVYESSSTTVSGALDVNEGYGLAKITYRTQVYEYRVEGVAGSTVQFIMKDEA